MRGLTPSSVFVCAAILTLGLSGCENATQPDVGDTVIKAAVDLAPPVGQEPYVVIDDHPDWNPIGTVTMPPMFRLTWKAASGTGVRRVRYLFHRVEDPGGVYDPTFNIIEDLNANPRRYEDLWSRWYAYPAANGMGSEVIIGDDEELHLYSSYVFAVQAIGPRKSITTNFTSGGNARIFLVSFGSRLQIEMSEPHLGDFTIPVNGYLHTVEIETGSPVNFSWQGDASYYGGEVAGYRYGWDIMDPDDPSQWDTELSIENVSAPERVLWTGVHTLYVEAVDTYGSTTMGGIRFVVVMEQALPSRE